jgi:hypothetical protein
MLKKRLQPKFPIEGGQPLDSNITNINTPIQEGVPNINSKMEIENNIKIEGEGQNIMEKNVNTHIFNEEHISKDKKKVRCKKWPICKNDTCEYAHPKETVNININLKCPFFPKCVFGDKCLYIHPNIACKYGFYCTRVGCAYSHPAGYNPGMGMMAPQMAMSWGGGAHPKFKNPKLDNSKIKLK